MNYLKQNERIMMLKLAEIEERKLTEHKQRQTQLKVMLPKFEAAASLIRDELAPFRRYGRQPYVKISHKNKIVWLRVTLKKETATAARFNWLNESYSVMPSGDLQHNHAGADTLTECDATQIAQHFLTLHRDKILERFERLLPG